MGRKNRQPRSALYSDRLLQPVIGARHPIVEDDNLAFFFSEARYVLDRVVPPKAVKKQDRIRTKSTYMLYEDPDRVGLSILEQRLARTHAQRNRIRWTRNDVGRIQGEIQNELSRLALSGRNLDVTFDGVVRLGDADERKARKLAIVPAQETEIAEFLCAEHELAVNGLSGSMQRFRYPYAGAWVPHLTVGRVFKEVEQEHLNNAVSAIKQLMPLTLTIEPIKFFAEQEIHHTATSGDMFDEFDSEEFGT